MPAPCTPSALGRPWASADTARLHEWREGDATICLEWQDGASLSCDYDTHAQARAWLADNGFGPSRHAAQQ